MLSIYSDFHLFSLQLIQYPPPLMRQLLIIQLHRHHRLTHHHIRLHHHHHHHHLKNLHPRRHYLRPLKYPCHRQPRTGWFLKGVFENKFICKHHSASFGVFVKFSLQNIVLYLTVKPWNKACMHFFTVVALCFSFVQHALVIPNVLLLLILYQVVLIWQDQHCNSKMIINLTSSSSSKDILASFKKGSEWMNSLTLTLLLVGLKIFIQNLCYALYH